MNIVRIHAMLLIKHYFNTYCRCAVIYQLDQDTRAPSCIPYISYSGAPAVNGDKIHEILLVSERHFQMLIYLDSRVYLSSQHAVCKH